ncbi:MAG: ubiquitin-like small modifier protein 1 [Gemmatimonadota bacterium]|nr:ubiquitin-like small modifier protein 1 [Gemmatimonadota bacterium]
MTISLPGQLRDLAEGRHEVVLDTTPASVGDAMRELRERYPAVYERVLTEQGEVRPHVNLFVDGTEIRRTGGLATALGDGASIDIIPSVSGG